MTTWPPVGTYIPVYPMTLVTIRNAARLWVNQVVRPDKWTLSEPEPSTTFDPADPATRPPCTAVAVPVENYRSTNSGPHGLTRQFGLEFQVWYRFPNWYEYHQLPLSAIDGLGEYWVASLEAHPDLLTWDQSKFDQWEAWTYPNVDPCSYEPGPPLHPACVIKQVGPSYSVKIMEHGDDDWLICLSLATEVKEECTFAALIPTDLVRPLFHPGLVNVVSLEAGLHRTNHQVPPGQVTDPSVVPQPDSLPLEHKESLDGEPLEWTNP